MKKSILIYTYQAATLLLVLLFVSNSSVFAQRRGSNQSQRTQSRSEIINKKPERQNHSRHQRNKARNSRSRYSYSNQDRHSSTHHSHYHYRHKQPRSRKYRQPNHCSNVIIRHNRYVTHPKYGEVVIRFGHPPKLLYHRHGHYYYSQGVCYQYMPAVGYVRVNTLLNSYFMQLPTGYSKVWYKGRNYYMWNELCFVKQRRGYRIISPPKGIHIHIEI